MDIVVLDRDPHDIRAGNSSRYAEPPNHHRGHAVRVVFVDGVWLAVGAEPVCCLGGRDACYVGAVACDDDLGSCKDMVDIMEGRKVLRLKRSGLLVALW